MNGIIKPIFLGNQSDESLSFLLLPPDDNRVFAKLPALKDVLFLHFFPGFMPICMSMKTTMHRYLMVWTTYYLRYTM